LNTLRKAQDWTLQGKSVVCTAIECGGDCGEDLINIAAVLDSESEAEAYIDENIDASDADMNWFIYRLPRSLKPEEPTVPEWDDTIPF
jgi:hypothetical protein